MDRDGLAPVLSAAEANSFEAMETLLGRRAALTAADGDNYTALHWVCGIGNEGLKRAVGLLLRWNADVKALPFQDDHPVDLIVDPPGDYSSDDGYPDDRLYCPQETRSKVRVSCSTEHPPTAPGAGGGSQCFASATLWQGGLPTIAPGQRRARAARWREQGGREVSCMGTGARASAPWWPCL